MGAMGGGSPSASRARVRGIHSGEARTSDQHQIVQQWALVQQSRIEVGLLARLLARLLAKTIGNIGNIS